MEYAKQQIENSVKIEATIGIGITTIITTFVVGGAVTGLIMPAWAMIVLFALLVTFFAVRVMAYFRFIIEKEMFLREKRLDAEIHQNKLNSEIRKLDAQIKLKELEQVVV